MLPIVVANGKLVHTTEFLLRISVVRTESMVHVSSLAAIRRGHAVWNSQEHIVYSYCSGNSWKWDGFIDISPN
ncbi:hypothetical protein PAXRUDRAFT_823815 [Paxillus rubicundulus Ve08.2h10]|uniref:Uncharacterized protein n=1 Tax=Paxillus rubicundulus Ve08.2h10 TaxID=930991 RepID=A0A0D0DV65_9AGAM|nr:hypothetical protein PAXRUDRAFT_823815 [Paxillus rubicundulus Ve08.2h10]